ncbi:MAG: hypothetical protein ACAH22_09730 [Tardiphaga sp.]
MKKGPEDDADVAGRRSTGQLHMLDGLGAEVDWQDEISVWLDELSDREFHRILQSETLRDAVGDSRLTLSTIRYRSALGHAMRELGISPAQLADARAPQTLIVDGKVVRPSNVIPFRPRLAKRM